MAEPGDETARAVRPPLKVLSRDRVIALATQAASVVFAVLVALAIDEWWEVRENAELGRRGITAIAAEVRSNLETLESRRDQTNRVLAGIDTALAELKAGSTDSNIEINYPVALLSSAAWQSAQVTRAVNYVDIDRVIRIARTYDLQLFFLRNQERLTDMISDIASNVGDDPARIVGEIGRRYRLVAGFRDALANSYRCLLIQLEDGTPDPSCNEDP